MSGLLLKNGDIIIGSPGTERLDQVDILIEEGVIRRISPPGTIKPGDAETADMKGKTLLPGLINAHVHITMDPLTDPAVVMREWNRTKLVLNAVGNLRKQLLSGVTYFRDLGAPEGLDLELRNCVREGLIPGPEFLAAGRMITMTGGHGFLIGRECDGPDEVRKAAREQIKAGADVIKIMATGGVMTPGNEPGAPQLTLEEMQAAVEEAHKAGRKAAAHAQGSRGIRDALLAGIDSIEHGISLDDDMLELMLKHGVYLVPTLAAPHFIIEGGAAGGAPAFAVEKTKRILEHHCRSFERARTAGVKIAMGTDAGTPFNRHDRTSVELELMVAFGMSPYEAIRAATASAADLLGIADRYGSLAEGKVADIIAVSGDPLKDISVLGHVEQVYKKGILIT
jgi:imidazolonepropionase-like amidohydrolase